VYYYNHIDITHTRCILRTGSWHWVMNGKACSVDIREAVHGVN